MGELGGRATELGGSVPLREQEPLDPATAANCPSLNAAPPTDGLKDSISVSDGVIGNDGQNGDPSQIDGSHVEGAPEIPRAPGLPSATERFLSLDFDSLEKALERFKFDTRLAMALRVPPQAAVPPSQIKSGLPPPPPPLDFHRVYSSVDTLLAVHEQQALQVYAESCPQMLSLDREIEGSERLLAGVESRLHALSEDLGASGSNTRHVEQQSSALATRARNRKEAYVLLQTYLQQITLTRELVKAVCDGSLEEDPKAFLQALKELEKKIEHAKQPGMRQYKSTEASLPELYRLRDCAAQRIVSHLQQRIALLRQPRTNIHIIQRGELLKHKDLYLFLTDQAPASAVALKDEYTRVISSVYASLFKSYHNQLMGMLAGGGTGQQRRQQQQGPAGGPGAPCEGPQEVDAGDATAAAAGKHSQPSAACTCCGPVLHSLGDRDEILSDLDAEPLVAVHMARPLATSPSQGTSTVYGGSSTSAKSLAGEGANVSPTATTTAIVSSPPNAVPSTSLAQTRCQDSPILYYEQLFRSHQKLLLDTATSELIFVTDFFLNAGQQGKKLWARNSLCEVLQGSVDAIGVALMLRINQHSRQLMQRRKVPCLSSYLDQRLNDLLLVNIKTLRAVRSKEMLPAPPGSTVPPLTTAPHPVARSTWCVATHFACIAELASALAYLQQPLHGLPALPEEPLKTRLSELHSTALDVLMGLSQEFTDRRSQQVFLLNNYDTLLSLMHSRRVLPDVCATLEHLLWEQVNAYVEAQLKEHFADLVSSVRTAEEVLAAEQPLENPAHLSDVAHLERAVTQFHGCWRQRLSQLHEESVAAFPNVSNAMEILKQVLTQLLLLYTRLQQIVSTCFPKPPQPAWARQLVPLNTILTEVRRFSRNI
ncbi:vacuolar protein sorting-associated protein 52 A [Cyclospora cayetanensis]|uniref:Vacuolar protein sorting-associated protein 52 A n=1 Tax=Cyclospora cayetanensis TaxID=88456 RepID=A0A6P6RXD1_9EIME|nr:vacuolar protein sorting-associated protein 52 A [Cyclospora cayetanensis]